MNFKAPNGKYYTRQLFWEESIELTESTRSIPPIFSLYSDKPGLINFGREYVESEDPTGYKVSQKLLDGYRLWSILMKCTWFQTAKKLWDEEMDARLCSKGLEQMKDLLENGAPAQRAVAAKYFADKEYRKDKTASRGRPSKEQVTAETRKIATVEKQVNDDFQRINKTVNL